MVISDNSEAPRVRRVIIRPNRSLSWQQSLVFFAVLSVPLLLVSGLLASQGYWLVLPFAGIELAALFLCLYLVAHAATRCEVVSVGDAVVTVEKGRDRSRCQRRGGPEECTEFARGWVRVELSKQAAHWYPRRLWLSASGRRVELGAFLVDEEKEQLAAVLHRLLSA
jgi:uncharacterized membrane protein